MPNGEHKLTNIIEDEHGVGGVCTCGRWGGAAKTRRKLNKLHDEHKHESK